MKGADRKRSAPFCIAQEIYRLLPSLPGLPSGLEKEEADDEKGSQGCDPLGDMPAEAVGEHYAAQNKNGVHGTVFEIDIFFDPFDAVNRELPDNDGPDPVSKKNEGHRQRESEGPHDAVDGEGQIDHLEVEDLPDIGHVSFAGKQACLLLLGIAFEAVGDEEGRGANDGPEGKHGVVVHSEPHDEGERNGNHGIEPGSVAGDDALNGKADLLRFHEDPVAEQENEKDPSSHQENGGAFLYSLQRRRIAREACCEGIPGPQTRSHHPDDEPGEHSPDDEDGDQNPPGEKPPARPGLHAPQDLGVDDGVVDTGDRFEEGKPQNDE